MFAVCRLLLNIPALVCRAHFSHAVCRLWLNVRSCVEHKLVLPCVGFS